MSRIQISEKSILKTFSRKHSWKTNKQVPSFPSQSFVSQYFYLTQGHGMCPSLSVVPALGSLLLPFPGPHTIRHPGSSSRGCCPVSPSPHQPPQPPALNVQASQHLDLSDVYTSTSVYNTANGLVQAACLGKTSKEFTIAFKTKLRGIRRNHSSALN